MKQSSPLALLMTISFALLSGGCGDAWEREPGALTAIGDQVTLLKGGPGCVVSMHGWRRISVFERKDAALWHALVLQPLVDSRASGGGFNSQVSSARTVLSWEVLDGSERELEFRWNSLDRTLSVGQESFSVDTGNLFIVRLDQAWQPFTTQLSTVVSEELSPQEVLSAIKHQAPSDAGIQDLEVD
jgi:hypothetical protein